MSDFWPQHDTVHAYFHAIVGKADGLERSWPSLSTQARKSDQTTG